MKSFSILALILVIVGALNWGLVALFEWDMVAGMRGNVRYDERGDANRLRTGRAGRRLSGGDTAAGATALRLAPRGRWRPHDAQRALRKPVRALLGAAPAHSQELTGMGVPGLAAGQNGQPEEASSVTEPATVLAAQPSASGVSTGSERGCSRGRRRTANTDLPSREASGRGAARCGFSGGRRADERRGRRRRHRCGGACRRHFLCRLIPTFAGRRSPQNPGRVSETPTSFGMIVTVGSCRGRRAGGKEFEILQYGQKSARWRQIEAGDRGGRCPASCRRRPR